MCMHLKYMEFVLVSRMVASSLTFDTIFPQSHEEPQKNLLFQQDDLTYISHILQVGMGNSDYLAAFFHVLLPMAFEVLFYCSVFLNSKIKGYFISTSEYLVEMQYSPVAQLTRNFCWYE